MQRCDAPAQVSSRRVAAQKRRLLRCTACPHPGAGGSARLASTAFALQRAPRIYCEHALVNEADSTYFRIQYERGNLRVADVTGPASPGVPDSRLTEDDLRHYRALHDRSVGHCPTESSPSK